MAGAVTATEGLIGACRLVIQPSPEGVYLFVFETEASVFPEQDWLQDSVEDARVQAQEDFGARPDSWTPWEGASLV